MDNDNHMNEHAHHADPAFAASDRNMSKDIKESARLLLTGIIDYAGLFPPSKLPMSDAVINYATYRNSNYSWMLGRFVCPVGRLEEFLESARDFFARDRQGVWPLSVLAGDDIHETVRTVDEFNAKNSPHAICDMLELKADTPDRIEKWAAAIPGKYTSYFEVPYDDSLPETISALALSGKRAKIRTGGVTPDLFPRTHDLIRFIRTCLAANVPFKATAGLHHPIRCFKPLTYEPNAPKGTMHGFLNLFLATGFAREGYKAEILEEILEEEFEEVFDFHEKGVYWQKEYLLTNAMLANLRMAHVNSFGSCSFDEPIADLRQIGIL